MPRVLVVLAEVASPARPRKISLRLESRFQMCYMRVKSACRDMGEGGTIAEDEFCLRGGVQPCTTAMEPGGGRR